MNYSQTSPVINPLYSMVKSKTPKSKSPKIKYTPKALTPIKPYSERFENNFVPAYRSTRGSFGNNNSILLKFPNISMLSPSPRKSTVRQTLKNLKAKKKKRIVNGKR